MNRRSWLIGLLTGGAAGRRHWVADMPAMPDDPSTFLFLVNHERQSLSPPLPPLTWDQYLVRSPDATIPKPGVFVLSYPGRSYEAAFEVFRFSSDGYRAMMDADARRLAVWRDSERGGPGITAIIE